MGFRNCTGRDNDHELGELFRCDDSDAVHEVVGYITSPAVILRDIRTGVERVCVIRSLTAEKYRRLVPETYDADKVDPSMDEQEAG